MFIGFDRHKGHEVWSVFGRGTLLPSLLDAAYKVHTVLGPGLLESVYGVAMKHVIETNGALVEREVKLPIMFEGVLLDSALRIDMLVNKCVIAELRSVENTNPVFEA